MSRRELHNHVLSVSDDCNDIYPVYCLEDVLRCRILRAAHLLLNDALRHSESGGVANVRKCRISICGHFGKERSSKRNMQRSKCYDCIGTLRGIVSGAQTLHVSVNATMGSVLVFTSNDAAQIQCMLGYSKNNLYSLIAVPIM